MNEAMNNPITLVTEPIDDYELLDSGEGEKLERFGKFVLSRPDPQALWRKRLPVAQWKKADGSFSREGKEGGWTLSKGLPEKWQISFGPLKFWIKPSSFKHVGIFPEQDANWKWMHKKITENKEGIKNADVEILNLFGYTGGATLACSYAGAKVVHVDGSKVAIAAARENAGLSGFDKNPIRWILEDARAFVKREIRRGRKYQGIILDPPAFGHGPEKELWKIDEHFLEFIEDCFQLLSDKPLFFMVNGYSAGYSAIAYENNLLALQKKFGGGTEIGELTIKESGKEGRLLPSGIFARWSA